VLCVRKWTLHYSNRLRIYYYASIVTNIYIPTTCTATIQLPLCVIYHGSSNEHVYQRKMKSHTWQLEALSHAIMRHDHATNTESWQIPMKTMNWAQEITRYVEIQNMNMWKTESQYVLQKSSETHSSTMTKSIHHLRRHTMRHKAINMEHGWYVKCPFQSLLNSPLLMLYHPRFFWYLNKARTKQKRNKQVLPPS
jgi:tRNA uridine 5-carbamoylmethylation protein Kti12